MNVLIARLPEIIVDVLLIIKDRQINILHAGHHRAFFAVYRRHLMRLIIEKKI